MEMQIPRTTGLIGLGEALSWVAWQRSIPHLDLCSAIDANELGDDAKDRLNDALRDLLNRATSNDIAVYGKPRKHLTAVERDTVPITRTQLFDHQRYEIVHDALLRGHGLVWWPSPLEVILNENDAGSGFEGVLVDRAGLVSAFPPPDDLVGKKEINPTDFRPASSPRPIPEAELVRWFQLRVQQFQDQRPPGWRACWSAIKAEYDGRYTITKDRLLGARREVAPHWRPGRR